MVNVDVGKLERMVYNLVGNSIKFTPPHGMILLECLRGDDLTILVRDTGPGIDRDKLNLIFERFYQIEHNNTEGSGIGLALVKAYIDLHHGEATVTSTEQEGPPLP